MKSIWKWIVGVGAGAIAFVAGIFVGNNNAPAPANSDTTNVIVKLPAIYGVNGNVFGFPLDFDDPVFSDSISNLHIGMIRFPAGTAANSYNWHTGKKEDSSGKKVTLDELKVAVDKSHCQIIYVLNMVTHSCEDQIEMLKYAKSIGLPVNYAEFGNEMSNMGTAGLVKFRNGTNYGDTCKSCAEKIKKEFDIKLGIVAENKPTLPTWLPDCLAKYPNPDGLITHIYVDPHFFIINGKLDTSKLKISIDNACNRAGFLKYSFPVWVTEFNVAPAYINLISNQQHTEIVEFMFKYFTELGFQLQVVHNITGLNGVFGVSEDGKIILQATGVAVHELLK